MSARKKYAGCILAHMPLEPQLKTEITGSLRRESLKLSLSLGKEANKQQTASIIDLNVLMTETLSVLLLMLVNYQI